MGQADARERDGSAVKKLKSSRALIIEIKLAIEQLRAAGITEEEIQLMLRG